MQTKTSKEWKEIFDKQYVVERMFNLGNLKNAMSTVQWQDVMNKTRVNSDMADVNHEFRMKNSSIRMVAVSTSGTNALGYFWAVSNMGRHIPDSELRPKHIDLNNKKTKRTWKYAETDNPIEIFEP
jgi:hypothetical protein